MNPATRLVPWLQFLRERSHVLTRYPELLWQEAANQPSESMIARRARQVVGRGERPWLEQLGPADRGQAERLTLRGHTDLVEAVVVSPETNRIVSAGIDKTIRVWDSGDGREILRLEGHTGPIRGLALTPDRRRVTSAGDDMMLLVWDLTTGAELKLIAGNHRAVTAIAPFHQRPWVVTGTEDGRLNVFDLDEGSRLFSLVGHRQRVGTLAVSADDRLIASGSGDRTVRIWDVGARREMHLLRGHRESVAAVAFTPDGKYLISAFREVLLWDSARGRRLRRWRTAVDPIRALAVVQDGEQFLAASGRGVLTIRDSLGNRPARLLRVPTPIDWLVLEGNRLYTTSGQSHDHTVKVWDRDRLASGELETRHLADVNALAFTSNGYLVSGSADRSVRIWEPEHGAVLHSLAGHQDAVSAVAASPGGAVIVSGGGGYWSKTNTILRWDASTGRQRGKIPVPEARVTALALTPDGRQVAAGLDTRGSSGVVKLWDTRTRRLLRSYGEHHGEIAGLAIAGPDIISVSRGLMVHATPRSRFELGGLRIWSLETGAERLAFPAPHLHLHAVAVSPDGALVAAVSSDGTIPVWRVADGTPVTTLGRPVVRDRDPGWARLIPEHTPERHEQLQVMPTALVFAWSGTGLFSADGAGVVTLRELDTGRVLARYVASAPILSLATWHDLIAVGESGGGLCVLRVHGVSGLGPAAARPPARTRPWWRFWNRS